MGTTQKSSVERVGKRVDRNGRCGNGSLMTTRIRTFPHLISHVRGTVESHFVPSPVGERGVGRRNGT